MDEEVEEWDYAETGSQWWVIPHWSSLDYCSVTIIGEPDAHDRVRVEGTRSHGWKIDHAKIKTRVPLDKLTKTPSWHNDFKDLYEDPCQPERRSYS